MRSRVLVVSSVALFALLVFVAGYSIGQDKKANSRVYELRTYTTVPGRLPALNKRFAEHTMRLFEKHGIKNEMYWLPTDEDNKLIYFVSHASREEGEKNWREFGADPDWKKVQTESQTEANGGKIVEKVERVWMKLTDYSPVR